MKTKLFVIIFTSVLVIPLIAILVSSISFAFMENQVVEFCEDIKIGMNQKDVISKADKVIGTHRKKITTGKYQETLNPIIFDLSSCEMGFEKNMLTTKYLNIN